MLPTAPNCAECQDTGFKPATKDGKTGVQRCDCYKHARMLLLPEFARIPARYKTATLDNFMTLENPTLEQARNVAEHFVNEYPMATPQGLMFMGRPGLGKTHLAVGIMHQLIRTKSIPCLFCDFPDLLREIQNSYNPLTKGSESLILAPILDAEVLVLDDLGSQKWSEWVQDMLGHVINDRYSHGRCTIFTTNYLDPAPNAKELEQSNLKRLQSYNVIDASGNIDKMKVDQLERLGIVFPWSRPEDSLEARIGERVRSRLREMCKVVSMTGEDFRRQKGTRNLR
jgi:DNA replication protein DnaC